jgi:hypothetical protein
MIAPEITRLRLRRSDVRSDDRRTAGTGGRVKDLTGAGRRRRGARP